MIIHMWGRSLCIVVYHCLYYWQSLHLHKSQEMSNYHNHSEKFCQKQNQLDLTSSSFFALGMSSLLPISICIGS